MPFFARAVLLPGLILGGLLLPAGPASAQYDTCEYALDNECDEARYGGTGFCTVGTDASDCRFLAAGGTANACQWAFDGECDEPRYAGTGACVDGSDTADCAPLLAQNGCPYAFDNECDEARFGGTGLCPQGTDARDCAALALGVDDNSCQWAFDNECDEPRFGGTGACADGTDTADCQPGAGGGIASGGDNSCTWAFDNECDEPRFGGTGACADGTDTADCQPGAGGGTTAAVPGLGNDSCQWSFDLECDDARYGGTGACRDGTDASDCRALALGGDNSCQWANDGECDEPDIGLGVCASGTDTNDCAAVAFLRNRDNNCALAFNGQCDESDGGTGRCGPMSDTADCVGRNRPAEAYDHYFGRDDRFLPDSNAAPWRAIGLLDIPGSSCTGTLVGPRTVLTAAHCVLDEDGRRIVLPTGFRAGASGDRQVARAGIVDAFAAPDYTPEPAAAGRGNGNDWAFVTLDRDLGNSVGIIPVHMLSTGDLNAIAAGGLLVDQAGYSWDTGAYLSGHRACRIVDAFDDGTILHECDTTHGDSGSPILLTVNGRPHVIAVDSQFFDPLDKNSAFTSANMAVDSRAFAGALEKLGLR